ncbi:hypothetical protein LCGC14_2640810 [marine sediment metagenome]|uniref:Uncharacterized protein n=1 Tax=marine sediment metagenome TaxID=412755 RepID=A0A0F9CPU2_9ZZZZ
MAKYKFRFETGHIYDGSIEVVVKDFIGEVEGKVNPSLALTIEAHGGQLMTPGPKKTKAKGRKVNPVEWPADKAASDVTDLLEKIKRKNEGVEK